MGLSQLAGALLIQGAALVRDCCCLIFDKECSLGPCLRDTDCQFFPDCICIDGTCQDAIRDDCPPGYTEIPEADGKVKCEPNCTGEPCQSTADCGEGCVCVDGRCVPSSDAFFCIDGSCERGGDLEFDPADPDRPKGPYPTYQACCMSPDEDGNLCGCGFACTDSCQCVPSENGAQYEDYQECRASCCDPSDAGRCCYNEVIKNADGVRVRVEWWACADSLNEDCVDGPIEDTADGGTRQITSSFTKGVSCNPDFDPPGNLPNGEGCPIPAYGACCILDGDEVIECIEEGEIVCDEMPDRPQDFPQYPDGFTTESKASRWQTCEELRTPEPDGEEYACDDCNGEKDCACESDERCNVRECITCYDDDPSKRGEMVLAQAGVDNQIGSVSKGETVSYYIRNCVADATGAQSPVTKREAIVKIIAPCGESAEQTITDEGQLETEVSGTMYITLAAGEPNLQICITRERDVPSNPDCGNCTYDFVNKQDDQGNFTWEQTASTVGFADGVDEWADGWPLCTGVQNLEMVRTRRSSSIRGEVVSLEEVLTLYLCDNGSYTDVTSIAVKKWLSASFASGCLGGGNVGVAAGQTAEHITYTLDRVQCISSDQWNAYGNLIDVELPEPDRWNCVQNRSQNPLP